MGFCLVVVWLGIATVFVCFFTLCIFQRGVICILIAVLARLLAVGLLSVQRFDGILRGRRSLTTPELRSIQDLRGPSSSDYSNKHFCRRWG